jgi:hypothetical protein
MAHQRARVQIRNDGHAARVQEFAGHRIGAPVAGQGRELSDHQPFDVRAQAFVIVAAGPIVADLRVGQDDDLAGVRRICEYFLIAGERGIEDDFAGALGGRTKTPALEDRSVFQGEDCSTQVRLFLPGSG